MYLGDGIPGTTIFYGKFTTRGPSGLPTTLSGSPTLAVYKDASTTELTTGVTLVVDFDSRTGLNHFAVDTTADASAYVAGEYSIVITAGTVTSVTVIGEVVAHFSLNNRSALRPTTAGRTLDVSAGGEAGVDWANVGSPTTTLNLSGTTVGTVSALAAGSITAAVIATGAVDADALAADAVAEIADGVWDEATSGHTTAGTFGKLDADIKVDTAAILDDTGTSGVIVASLAAGSITAAVIATGAIDADALAADAGTELADAIWDEVVEGSTTARQSTRLWNAALSGKASGLATTTAVYRDIGDTKDRITATVDADGNRTAVTLDVT